MINIKSIVNKFVVRSNLCIILKVVISVHYTFIESTLRLISLNAYNGSVRFFKM